MKARLGGKPWEAGYMLLNDQWSPSRRVEGHSGDESIAFYVWMPGLKTGARINFFRGGPAELLLSGNENIWSGNTGVLRILRVDEHVLEGSFYFGATSSSWPDSLVHVTDGFFRIPLSQQ